MISSTCNQHPSDFASDIGGASSLEQGEQLFLTQTEVVLQSIATHASCWTAYMLTLQLIVLIHTGSDAYSTHEQSIEKQQSRGSDQDSKPFGRSVSRQAKMPLRPWGRIVQDGKV